MTESRQIPFFIEFGFWESFFFKRCVKFYLSILDPGCVKRQFLFTYTCIDVVACEENTEVKYN